MNTNSFTDISSNVSIEKYKYKHKYRSKYTNKYKYKTLVREKLCNLASSLQLPLAPFTVQFLKVLKNDLYISAKI